MVPYSSPFDTVQFSYPCNRPVFVRAAVMLGSKEMMPFSSANISPAQKGIEYGSRLKIR
jgi:hypothetical protein